MADGTQGGYRREGTLPGQFHEATVREALLQIMKKIQSYFIFKLGLILFNRSFPGQAIRFIFSTTYVGPLE